MSTDKPKSDLGTRALVGVVLIAVAAGALIVGGFPFWTMLAIAGVLMLAEWGNLARSDPKSVRLAQFALVVPLAIMSPLAVGASFFALGLVIGAAFFVMIVTRRTMLGSGIFYVGLPVLALVYLRHHDNGIVLTLWAMALVWATDIGAYFAGRSIGGPKLAPKVSPNKTWAGLGGGVVAAAIFGGVMTRFGLPVQLAFATPFLAVLAQLGDLYESGLKRRAGIKDSGNILPGHGGLLDRLDGLVPVAPVAALLVLALGYAQ